MNNVLNFNMILMIIIKIPRKILNHINSLNFDCKNLRFVDLVMYFINGKFSNFLEGFENLIFFIEDSYTSYLPLKRITFPAEMWKKNFQMKEL